MRRLSFIIATLTAVMFSINDTQAFDVKGKWTIAPFGGIGIPLGDFADDGSRNRQAGGAKTGFGLGLAIEYGITEQFLVGGRFAFHRFGVTRDALGYFIDEEGITSPGDSIDAHWNIAEIVGAYGKVLLLPTCPTRPYLRAGVFLGKPKFVLTGATVDRSKDFDVSLGFEAAIGAEHMFSKHVGAGLEGRFAYLHVNDKGSEVWGNAAGISGPNGVRDPGGNLNWLDATAYVVYGF